VGCLLCVFLFVFSLSLCFALAPLFLSFNLQIPFCRPALSLRPSLPRAHCCTRLSSADIIPHFLFPFYSYICIFSLLLSLRPCPFTPSHFLGPSFPSLSLLLSTLYLRRFPFRLLLSSASLLGFFAYTHTVSLPLLSPLPLATWSASTILVKPLHNHLILQSVIQEPHHPPKQLGWLP